MTNDTSDIINNGNIQRKKVVFSDDTLCGCWVLSYCLQRQSTILHSVSSGNWASLWIWSRSPLLQYPPIKIYQKWSKNISISRQKYLIHNTRVRTCPAGRDHQVFPGHIAATSGDMWPHRGDFLVKVLGSWWGKLVSWTLDMEHRTYLEYL